jgi:hypothetical protein
LSSNLKKPKVIMKNEKVHKVTNIDVQKLKQRNNGEGRSLTQDLSCG